MKNHSKLTKCAAACCALFLISGCGPSAPPEIKDAPIDLTPTNELIIYIPAYSTLDPVIARYRELYPEVNLIEVLTTESHEPYAYDTRLSEDLAAGIGPDVIFPSSAYNMNDYKAANSGMFLNLNEIIAQDADFNTGDYIKSVFDGGVFRGGRYIIPLTYTLYSYTANTVKLSNMGFDSSQTGDAVSFLNEVARCLPVAGSDPEFMYLFPGEKYLPNLLRASGIALVDYETNTVLPDEENLLKLLEAYKPYYSVDYDETRVHNNIFSDPYTIDEVFSGASALKGSGDGFSTVTMRRMDGKLQAIAYRTAAIRAGSPNQLNAWNFIKLLLSPEFQGEMHRYIHPGLPVLKDAIGAEIERVGNVYGLEILKHNAIVYEQLSAQEKQAYLNLFLGVDYCYSYSEAQIYEIFIEHMEPYLKDEKSFSSCVSALKKDLRIYVAG